MLITLDFETYYDDDYTLKKLSTSAYVRDPRFEAISCSIKKGKNKPFCYFGHEKIAQAFENIDWTKAVLLAHHTQFDGLILQHHFGKSPAKRACTLSMARAVHPKSERADLATVAIHYGVTNKLTMPDFKGKHLADLTKAEIKQITAYNNADVQGCYEIYEKMLADGFPLSELDLVDITVKMFTEPVLLVDLWRAKKELKREIEAKRKAIEAVDIVPDADDIKKAKKNMRDAGILKAFDEDIIHAGKEVVLASSPKFVMALESLGVTIPMKPSPTVPGKHIPAVAKTDEELQALLLHSDPRVSALVEGRLAAKSTIGESRAARLIDYGSDGKKLPIYLNYAGAHTFRWSGGDKLNPQNFKQKAKVGGALRECIMAPPGYQLVVVDAAQIEARVVAWLADEEVILDAFRKKRDIYSEFATVAYSRPVTKADKEERFVGKTCILGLGFGMGAPKLQYTVLTQSINQGLDPVRLPLEVCFGLVNKYRAMYPKIKELWDILNNHAIAAMLPQAMMPFTLKCLKFERGGCKLPSGLTLLYPQLQANIIRANRSFVGGTERVQDASYMSAHARSKIYGGLLAENVVQALARIIVADIMREVAKRFRVVMMTHDEIVFLVKGGKKEAQAALDWAIGLMSEPPEWAPNLPLSAEGGYDVRYSK